MGHARAGELYAGLEDVRGSRAGAGTVELIVPRPDVDEREVIVEGTLDPEEGLVGDTWRIRGSAHPDMQLTLINARAIDLVAGSRERRALAGDQLYVDLDLSTDNLQPGTRLAVGSAVVVVSEAPHTGCAKFSGRFGSEALRFVNSPVGRALRLRGINAKVMEPGAVRQGDAVRKL
ncbi:MAG: MOSC domain-containing protein [Gaiellaceae bacterium]